MYSLSFSPSIFEVSFYPMLNKPFLFLLIQLNNVGILIPKIQLASTFEAPFSMCSNAFILKSSEYAPSPYIFLGLFISLSHLPYEETVNL